MRTLASLFLAVAALGFTACGGDTATYHNSLTGDVCTPSPRSYMPPGSKSNHAGCDADHCCLDGGPDAGCHGTHGGSADASEIPNPP